MGKYLALVMVTAIIGLVIIVLAAMSLGYDTGLATAGISALAAVLTGTAGVGGTYLVMKKKGK